MNSVGDIKKRFTNLKEQLEAREDENERLLKQMKEYEVRNESVSFELISSILLFLL
jgi:predicted nuclease with TOPRIM domain